VIRARLGLGLVCLGLGMLLISARRTSFTESEVSNTSATSGSRTTTRGSSVGSSSSPKEAVAGLTHSRGESQVKGEGGSVLAAHDVSAR
jgi:hypothetical protein